jgi:hypothetical protein
MKTTDVSWLAPMHLGAIDFSAADLRRALMTFLMDLAPRPNPVVHRARALHRRRATRRARVPERVRAMSRGAPRERRSGDRGPVRTVGRACPVRGRANRLGLARISHDGSRPLCSRSRRPHPVSAPPLQKSPLLHEWVGARSPEPARAHTISGRRSPARCRRRPKYTLSGARCRQRSTHSSRSWNCFDDLLSPTRRRTRARPRLILPFFARVSPSSAPFERTSSGVCFPQASAPTTG